MTTGEPSCSGIVLAARSQGPTRRIVIGAWQQWHHKPHICAIYTVTAGSTYIGAKHKCAAIIQTVAVVSPVAGEGHVDGCQVAAIQDAAASAIGDVGDDLRIRSAHEVEVGDAATSRGRAVIGNLAAQQRKLAHTVIDASAPDC